MISCNAGCARTALVITSVFSLASALPNRLKDCETVEHKPAGAIDDYLKQTAMKIIV